MALKTFGYVKKDLIWIDLQIQSQEFRPENSFATGQCFNWKHIIPPQAPSSSKSFSKSVSKSASSSSGKGQNNNYIPEDQYWIGIISDLPLLVRQTNETTFVCDLFHRYSTQSSPISSEHLIKHHCYEYFNISKSILPMYEYWSQQCPRMKVIVNCLPGLRIFRQDPWECMLSFICSSNNNIARIILILDRLRASYGNYYGQIHFSWLFSEDNQPPELCYEIILPSNNSTNTSSPSNPSNPSINMFHDSNLSISPIQTFDLYQFPSPSQLQHVTESELRQLGLGYRAKFIVNTLQWFQSQSLDAKEWLFQLRKLASDSIQTHSIHNLQPTATKRFTYVIKNEDESNQNNQKKETIITIKKEKKKRKYIQETQQNKEEEIQKESSNITINENQLTQSRQYVQSQLLQLPGIGQKVADCIALFSLDQIESVPIDTHVYSIIARDYDSSLGLIQSITPKKYEMIANAFRHVFKYETGWAHSVLFAAELTVFHSKLPIKLVEEIKLFANQQRQEKAQIKRQKY